MRRPDPRRTHGPTDRSPVRDRLSWYMKELDELVDGPLKAHLMSGLRRAMRTHREPAERDFALAAERLYAVTVDSSIPAAERRRALGSWMVAMKELALVAKRAERRPKADIFVPSAQPSRPDIFSAPPPQDEANDGREAETDDNSAA
jgi:hypothetical protein